MERTERLFNLVLALTSTAQPIPRETLRSIIDGYAQSSSDSAFERMFERDKDELRSLGVPIETVTTAEGEVLGYVIPRDDYRLPPVRFTGAQWSLLGVAARAWSEATNAEPARNALRKLEAAGGVDDSYTGGPGEVLSWQVRPEEGEQWLPVLWGAIRQRRPVSFAYRGLRDDEPRQRSLEPWSVIGQRGGWYVIGFDRDRQAPRAFRLSRISGAVEAAPNDGDYTIPDHDPTDMIEGSDTGDVVDDVWVAVAVGAGERLRMAAQDVDHASDRSTFDVPEGFDVVYLGGREITSLCADIAALGEQAVVLHPPNVADIVRMRLERVAEAHRIGNDARQHQVAR